MSSYLDEDLPLELIGRGESVCRDVHSFGQEHLSKHFLEVSGHVPLLDNAAVVFNGEDDGIAVEKHISRACFSTDKQKRARERGLTLT